MTSMYWECSLIPLLWDVSYVQFIMYSLWESYARRQLVKRKVFLLSSGRGNLLCVCCCCKLTKSTFHMISWYSHQNDIFGHCLRTVIHYKHWFVWIHAHCNSESKITEGIIHVSARLLCCYHNVFTIKRIDFKWAVIFAHMNLSSNGAVQFSLRPGDAGLQAMTGTSIDLSEATSWVFTRGHFPWNAKDAYQMHLKKIQISPPKGK